MKIQMPDKIFFDTEPVFLEVIWYNKKGEKLAVKKMDWKVEDEEGKYMKTRIPIEKLLDTGASVLSAVNYERDSAGVTVKMKTTIDLPYLDDEKYNEKLRLWTALLREAGVDFLHRQGMSGLTVKEEWTLEDDGVQG